MNLLTKFNDILFLNNLMGKAKRKSQMLLLLLGYDALDICKALPRLPFIMTLALTVRAENLGLGPIGFA